MTSIVEVEELGRRIRKCRLDSRMTLKAVEQASGLSATHLSEIERGRTSPTIGALVRIARALHRDASYFIEREERNAVAHQGWDAAPRVENGGGGVVDALTPGIPGSQVFAYRLQLGPGPGGEVKVPAHDLPGDAVYFVRRGMVDVSFGDQQLKLAPGDGVQATFAIPHVLRGAGEGAEVIAILTRPIGGEPE
jgi:mannose-6-phosphate isomerase-like protein (cupin superfamily)